jgi:hypothetical protein
VAVISNANGCEGTEDHALGDLGKVPEALVHCQAKHGHLALGDWRHLPQHTFRSSLSSSKITHLAKLNMTVLL